MKENDRRMTLNLYAELKESKKFDRYKRVLRDLIAQYKKAWIDSMCEEYGVEKVKSTCPHVRM